MCLLANLSMKLGRSVGWNGKTERTGDAEAFSLALQRDTEIEEGKVAALSHAQPMESMAQ